ncbi:MAG: hypothetical protein JWM57_1231, partial [Phycisphaerales bacterium]|nr:hypothetical protein [Phycisphaerales bacterium]
MITLDAGNVLLTHHHRKLLMSRLRRALALGERIGNFAVNVVLRRRGRHVMLTARVQDNRGDFEIRTKSTTLVDAFHDIARTLTSRL